MATMRMRVSLVSINPAFFILSIHLVLFSEEEDDVDEKGDKASKKKRKRNKKKKGVDKISYHIYSQKHTVMFVASAAAV